MKIRDFIEELKKLDPDMMVLQRRSGEYVTSYDTMDSWYPYYAIVEASDNVANTGRYYERDEETENTKEALIL